MLSTTSPALAGAIERRGGKLDRFDRERQEGGTDDRESHHARPWQQCDQGAERDEQEDVQARRPERCVVGERGWPDSRDVTACFSKHRRECFEARGQGRGDDGAEADQEQPGDRLAYAEPASEVPVERCREEHREREPRKESRVLTEREGFRADHVQPERALTRIDASVSTTRATSSSVMPGQIGKEMTRSYSFVATG